MKPGESLPIHACRCGDAVSVSIRNDMKGAQARCIDCRHSVSGESLESTIEKWNAWASESDTWKELFKELENYYCNFWCNGDECGTTECNVYGILERAKLLRN